MSLNVAVLLAGCGHLDGAEVNEAVMTLLGLRLAGFEPQVFALNEPQKEFLNHMTRKPETAVAPTGIDMAARIARGQVRPMSELKMSNYSALAIPGGLGVAKNFCNFSAAGSQAQVHPLIEGAVSDTLTAAKPLLAVCIAPALVGLVAAKMGRKLRFTLGDDQNQASLEMKKLGHQVRTTQAWELCEDADSRLLTTPAFMWDITLEQAWPGIQKATETLGRWAETAGKR
jgi:enhancing lycopene biosynthesis protein 2